MKKQLCFSFAVLMILLFFANVMAEEKKENMYAPTSFSEAGNGYLEFYQDGTCKKEGDSHFYINQENKSAQRIDKGYLH